MVVGKGKEPASSSKTSNSKLRQSGPTQLPSRTGELQKKRTAVKSLQAQLQTERAKVSKLKRLLLIKKETVAGQALKAAQLKTLKDDVQKKDEELTSVRKQLREAELKLKSSDKSREELRISYDQLKTKNKELNRMKTLVEVYEDYRRMSEDQSYRPLGTKKYASSELEMAVNRPNKESTGTTKYGAVYKSQLGQKVVVVEILNSKSQQDFDQKVHILTRLRHPNLVSYIGAYEKKYALICEHLPWGTLQDRLVNKSQTTPFSWEERVGIAASICSTLLFLHNTKPSLIIHGDLKAENISFDADNICRLSVFGMSRSTTNSNTAPSIQSDICAFGIVLLQMVTGQGEKDLVRKKVLKMGDANQFQQKDIRSQKKVLKSEHIVDGRLELDNCPTEDIVKMLLLGLRCSHPEENQRPDLATEVWTHIQSMKRGAPKPKSWLRGLLGF